jgi:hypothetical protein
MLLMACLTVSVIPSVLVIAGLTVNLGVAT